MIYGRLSSFSALILLLLAVILTAAEELQPKCITWQPGEDGTTGACTQWLISDPWAYDDDAINMAVRNVSQTCNDRCEILGKKCEVFIEAEAFRYKCENMDFEHPRGTPVKARDPVETRDEL
jgi:hypothetical protein